MGAAAVGVSVAGSMSPLESTAFQGGTHMRSRDPRRQWRRPVGAPAAIVLMMIAVLSACDSDQLPDEASLTLTPDERRFAITERRDEAGLCVRFTESYVDVPMLLTLKDNTGSPIGGRSVSVHVALADNAIGGRGPLTLYEDRNGNGIVDADSELASGPDDDVARIELGSVDGAGAFLLRANLSCGYRSEIFAFTGNVSASASIEVSAQRTLGPDGRPITEKLR